MSHRFFPDARSFRAWLKQNHKAKAELIVAFHRVGCGKKSITYPEALDEALCHGWIDGVRKSLNSTSYTTRFTPRKPNSNWSIVNIRRVKELMKLKRMSKHGLGVFKARDERRSERYSYERKTSKLSKKQQALFRTNTEAWNYFRSQAPWYQRVTTWWVISAVKEETRERRLRQLISDSAAGRRIHMLGNSKKSS